MKRVLSVVLIGIGLAATMVMTPTHAAPTSVITVNTTADELNTDGDCSLREAVKAANTNAVVSGCAAGTGTSDEIVLQASHTYTLSLAGINEDAGATGDLDLTESVTITGNSAQIQAGTTTGNGIDRVFHIKPGVVATLSHVTVRFGRAVSGGGFRVQGKLVLSNSSVMSNTATDGSGGALESISGASDIVLSDVSMTGNRATAHGGGMQVHGKLTITDSTLSGNEANVNGGGISASGDVNLQITNTLIEDNTADDDGNGSGEGGGIYADGIVTITYSTISDNSADDSGGLVNDGGTMKLIRSTVSGNDAVSAGGIRNHNNGKLSVINSTVSGNTASPGGAGGIANNPGTGTGAATVLDLRSATIAGNTAGGNGGGVNNSATLNARNSIIANNTATASADCSGVLTSQGYNLIENTSGCTIGGDTTGNKTGLDPNMTGLANNGGPTQTHALNNGSPAVDAGAPTGCIDQDNNTLGIDQRGFLRPVNGDGNASVVCDMGAFERLSPGTLTPTPTASLTVTRTPTNTRTPTRTQTPAGMLNFIGTVWEDQDRDGVRDTGEPRLAGITVEIWNAAKTQLHDTGLTNETGQYSLFGPPGGLRVHVVLPAGYTFSPFGVGAGVNGSQIRENGVDTGFSDVYTQQSGGLLVNAGMYSGVTPTPTVTATATSTKTATPTVTVTDIPFQTETPTATATATQNPVQSATPTRTRTFTPTATQTQSVGQTATLTRTATATTTSSCAAKPSKPTLKKPKDNATLTGHAAKLKWQAANCAASYSVIVKNFATNKKADKAGGLTKLTYKTKALAPATKFKWIVKACNSFGCVKSAKQTFTTAP